MKTPILHLNEAHHLQELTSFFFKLRNIGYVLKLYEVLVINFEKLWLIVSLWTQVYIY